MKLQEAALMSAASCNLSNETDRLKRLFDSFSAPALPSDSTRRATLRNPLVIESPRIGFLNLMASDAEGILRGQSGARAFV